MAAMAITSYTAARTTSAILYLSKRAWRLGIVLSKIDQGTEALDTSAAILTEEVKTLGLECDLVYAELETVTDSDGTNASLLNDIDGRIWRTLETLVQETDLTMKELESFVKRNRGAQPSGFGQPQQQRRFERNKEQISGIRTEVCRHTDCLHAISLLVNTIITLLTPGKIDVHLCKELERISSMIGVLHRSSEANSHSDIETTLIQCAREVIEKGTMMYQSRLYPEPQSGQKESEKLHSHVSEWIASLELLRQAATTHHDTTTDTTPGQIEKLETENSEKDGSDDDLETDLARASLETGVDAFEASKWDEADSLLQEALRGLQQLSKRQRAFCNIFDLQYRLSVCAFHIQPSGDAEAALLSLIRQPVGSDDSRIRVYEATHLLSQLYIRMGRYESAQGECEKALQARRRLLGKKSDASMESMALMAHIYVLLDNRARAKSYLSMIPEKNREKTLRKVEDSLGPEVEHLDFSSLLVRPAFEESDIRIERRNSGSTLGMTREDQSFRTFSLMAKTPAPSIRQPYRQNPPQTDAMHQLSAATSSPSPRRALPEWKREQKPGVHDAAARTVSDAASSTPNEAAEAETAPKPQHLSRKEILANIGCHPKEKLEEIVCVGDHPALVNFLGKKKEIWRSKFRKHVRPERLTALHFAALFGEIDMARRLLNSGFNINDVPYGYTTSLSPLKMAIGARQVSMVEFLIGQNAIPTEPETWATLAGQLMSRSWLEKTLSEADKDIAPNRIVSIMSILLKRGWNINTPFEASGNTVLHQAVSFWTGSYIWDLHLRVAVTTFLCQHNANPLHRNKDGKSPYDLALASGHQDLLMILEQGSKVGVASHVATQPVELSG